MLTVLSLYISISLLWTCIIVSNIYFVRELRKLSLQGKWMLWMLSRDTTVFYLMGNQ
jgi:hypothetical protein